MYLTEERFGSNQFEVEEYGKFRLSEDIQDIGMNFQSFRVTACNSEIIDCTEIKD